MSWRRKTNFAVCDGGAELPHSLQEEETIQEKSVKNLQEKKLLAQKAASLIKEKDVIFIDAGTTTAFFNQGIG